MEHYEESSIYTAEMHAVGMIVSRAKEQPQHKYISLLNSYAHLQKPSTSQYSELLARQLQHKMWDLKESELQFALS